MKGKNVLSTGDVAKICNVAPRTVSKWFDNGQLKGYRIPGSKDRRIPVSELIRFMKEHNMPAMAVHSFGKLRVLIVDSNDETWKPANLKTSKPDYEVQTAQSNCEAGMRIQEFSPHVVLINLMAEGIDAEEICRAIRDNEDLQLIKIIGFGSKLKESEAEALLKKGFDGYTAAGISDTNELVKSIEEATAIIY